MNKAKPAVAPGGASAGQSTVPSLSDMSADDRAAILAAVVDAVPEIIWFKDTRNNILWANRAAIARSGRGAEDLLGRNCTELSPREGDEYFEEDRRVIESRRPARGIVHRFRRANGERQVVITDKYPAFDATGEVSGIVAITRDLPAPAPAEEDASAEPAPGDREQRVLLEAMATTAPVGMFISDVNGRCSYVNDRWCRIWGVERAEAAAGGWIEAVHPDDRSGVIEDIARSIAGKRPFTGEFRVRRPDGSHRWVLSRAVPHLDEAGAVLALVGTTTDITSRKRTEEEVARLNRELEARVVERTAELQSAIHELESFCYAVSHDLRGPLRSLDGFSHALLEEYGDKLDATGEDWLKRLRAGSQRMGHLIDDLLTLSRLGRSQMRSETVDLSAIAADVLEELRCNDRGRRVAVEVEPGCTCTGDPSLLRVVMENLLDNAWKFTSRRYDARIRFASAPEEDGRRVFSVSDNGIGFDNEFGEKLFGMFQRLHPPSEFEGTGIGLANVRRIVERHGGRVWADGRPDAGATFFFTL
jgi:PAS domain S-box-containing protein